MPTVGSVAPRLAGLSVHTARRRSAPAVAPSDWAAMYATASRPGKWRVTVNATVTAGLMCAPERWPVA